MSDTTSRSQRGAAPDSTEPAGAADPTDTTGPSTAAPAGADSAGATGDAPRGGSDEAAAPGVAAPRPPTWIRLWWTPLVLLAVVGLLAAGAGLRDLLDRPPAEGSVDVGFARDMSEHHAQAVVMAMVEFRSGSDADVRAMAQDIALSQQREIGVMSSWLSGWGRSQVTTAVPMVWMPGHTTGDEHADHAATGPDGGSDSAELDPTVRMPGMASESELAELASVEGRDADVQFLTLMIRHHRGGVDMAQYAATYGQEDRVRVLARAMVVNQSLEIEQMQRYLEQLGAPRA